MNSPESTPFARLLKIGDFARLAGTNLRTLRYYEELGLLQPATRSEGGFRYYRPTDLNRLEMIKNLQELGLPLERIGDLMDTRNRGLERSAMLARVAAALSEQDRLIAQRIEQLEAQRQKLKSAASKLNECALCPHSPGHHNNYCEPCEHTGQPLPEHLSALY